MSKRKKGKKKILEGHKKVGSRFIPPMKQLPCSKSVGYRDQMLPELIWIGLINDNIGYIKGAKLIEKIFIAVEEIKTEDANGNFAYASCYLKLKDDEKSNLVNKFTSLGFIEELKTYLAPLISLYDDFPMRFIGAPSKVISNEQLVSKISLSVEKHVDKYNTPGIVLNGTSMLSRLITKKLHFAAHIDLPDFNSVIEAPDSKEAKRAASFLRANALAEFAMLNISDAWPRYFWNRGYNLSSCKFHMETKGEQQPK